MAATISTTSTVNKPINVVFEQTFLRRAQQLCPYFSGTTAGKIEKNAGTATIKWRRIEQATPSTTALSELTGTAAFMFGRNADTPTFTDVVATVAKYGQYYILNEEIDVFNPNGTTDEFVSVLGESAGRSLNQLMRDVLEDNATQRYAANVASMGAVKAKVAANDLDRILNELSKNSALTFMPMTNGSVNVGSAPILASYWAYCHPDVAYDVSGLTGFTSVEKYAGQTAIAEGEFGYYSRAGRGIRFIQSEDASRDAGAGAAISGADVNATSGEADTYSIVVCGRNAAGSVGLGMRHTDGVYRAGENTGSFEMIHHARGQSGIADPFNEVATLAWKAWFAGAILNANWCRSLRVAATNLAN
jgi:N4-gp56 family major capsid protein